VALEAPQDPLGAGDGDGGAEEESIGARDASRLFVAKHQREIEDLSDLVISFGFAACRDRS
jgi:hypothetical protein